MKQQTTELTSLERVLLALKHQEADRIPRMESFWPETIPLWKEQGMPEVDIAELFRYDMAGAGWITHQAQPGYSELIEETEAWATRKDGNGAILRYWKHKSGTPEHVGFTAGTPDAWRELKQTLLDVPPPCRVDVDHALRVMRHAHDTKRFFWWTGVECFEIAKDVIGHELLCIAMAENPEWAKDIFDTETDVAIRTLDYLEYQGVRFDGGWIYGDIAYNHGPFCSPRMYRQLVQPAHRRLVQWFKERGLPVIYHTDGDFRPLIPGFLEIGIDCFQPLEAKANVDARELKAQYGHQVTLMGNIDVMKMITNDRAVIEEEVASKIPALKQGGGYIYHSDHSVPPGVTWATYQFLMECVERYGSYAA